MEMNKDNDLRKKFSNTFKLLDEEIDNDKNSESVLKLNKVIEGDNENKNSETNKNNIEKKFDELEFKFKSEKEDKENDKALKEESIKHFKVLKFFPRLFLDLLDNIVVLALTYIYFLIFIKPQMADIPYKYIEGVTYFIINDTSNFHALLIGYFMIMMLYYIISNSVLKTTPAFFVFGYKIYKNNRPASILTMFLRNVFAVLFNVFTLMFSYWFVFISDDRQSLYDKIFSVYVLKEN